jgi:hypothetical protein
MGLLSMVNNINPPQKQRRVYIVKETCRRLDLSPRCSQLNASQLQTFSIFFSYLMHDDT